MYLGVNHEVMWLEIKVKSCSYNWVQLKDLDEIFNCLYAVSPISFEVKHSGRKLHKKKLWINEKLHAGI